MAGLTWLHLSDWHQKGKEFDRKVVRDELLDDIKSRKEISPQLEKIDFIIFSGDIAFSGQKEEYEIAIQEFFNPILEASGVDQDRLFIVPGNHDLNLKAIKTLPPELQKPPKQNDRPYLHSCLMDDQKRTKLFTPFKSFYDFMDGYTNQEHPDYACIREWTLNGNKVAILGLNSAWMSGRKKKGKGKIDDKGSLLVGEPQVHDILKRISEANVKIAVLHHPFDWLIEFDRDIIESRLMRKFNFILHGHQHKPRIDVIHGSQGDYILIPAGACYDRRIPEDPRYSNSYNFVHLDFDSQMGTIFLRHWSDPRTEWTKDHDSCDDGKLVFDLPEMNGHTLCAPSTTQSITSVASSMDGMSSATNKIDSLKSISIPHQIPPPPADFRGRKDDIEDILTNFGQGVAIGGIRGMGGIGKTALALVLSDRLKDRFPDGQIFIDMHGTSQNPLSSADAMAQVIRAYCPTDKIPDNPYEVHGRYFSVLDGKHTLLLLDNAASSEQVEPLFLPPGCAVLITSRVKFTLPGLKEKDLDILTEDEACELLLSIAGRIGDRAKELAKLCGYLPIALRNAAGALAEKKDLDVAEYEHRLNDKKKRLELVEASFSLSYELLSPARRRQWCRLSVFPGDFDRRGATAVLKIAPDLSSEVMRDLVKWSLVDFIYPESSESGRYKLHDLARIFAEMHLKPDELIDAQERHANHYLKVLSDAENLYREGRENILAGLDLFDREWTNIKSGQAWTEANTLATKKPKKKSVLDLALQMASDYGYNGIDLIRLRLYPRNCIEWIEIALHASKILKNRYAERSHLNNLGNTYSHLGDAHKAIDYYSQSLAINQETFDRKGEGANLGNLGIAYLDLGDARKAIDYCNQALAISRETFDRKGEGINLGNLSFAYLNLGDARKAIDYCNQALAINREIGDRRTEGSNLDNLGLAYSNLGDARLAIEYYDQALEISHEIGAQGLEADILCDMGNANIDLGDVHKSIECFELSLKIARKIGYRRIEGSALCNLGRAYADLGETSRSIECYEQSLKIVREIEYKRMEGDALFNMGLALDKLSQRGKAIENAQLALSIFEQIESPKAEKVRQKLEEWNNIS